MGFYSSKFTKKYRKLLCIFIKTDLHKSLNKYNSKFIILYITMVAFVPEVSNIDDKYIEFSVGFNPSITVNIDEVISTSSTGFDGSYGKLYKKGNNGWKVKIYKTKDLEIIQKLINCNVDGLQEYKKQFNNLEEGKDYVIKVSKVSTYRQLLTCYKEAIMTNKIYNSKRNNVDGSELVCKPYVCTPVFSKSWRFVFVSSVGMGKSVSSLLTFRRSLFRAVCKETMYNNLTEACDKLWRLGFVHNDLHPDNILYNTKTHKVTFIDLETSVEVMPEVTKRYIETQKDTEPVDCYVTFNIVMLDPALHMLRHSEKWLNEFSEKKPGKSRLLHNIDSTFLSAIRDMI